MTSPTAVIFDLDGVLVESTAVVERLWREWGRAHAIDEAELLKQIHGKRTTDVIRSVAPGLDPATELSWFERREVGDIDGVHAIPGALRIMEAPPAPRWAIVTSGSRPVATARLRAAGLPVPRVLVSADDVTDGKPDPEGYLLASRRLGVQPSEWVVIEDAPAGVGAARAAGMRVIGLATTHRPEQLAGCEFVVAGLSEVSSRLRRCT